MEPVKSTSENLQIDKSKAEVINTSNVLEFLHKQLENVSYEINKIVGVKKEVKCYFLYIYICFFFTRQSHQAKQGGVGDIKN